MVFPLLATVGHFYPSFCYGGCFHSPFGNALKGRKKPGKTGICNEDKNLDFSMEYRLPTHNPGFNRCLKVGKNRVKPGL